MSYSITVPLRVGDKVTARYTDEETGRSFTEELLVTEVCSKGFFVSVSVPPREDDLGEYIPYSELGKTYFVDGEVWMREEASHE